MPKKLEQALKRRATRLGFKPKSERWNRYVYGTLAKVKEAKKDGQ